MRSWTVVAAGALIAALVLALGWLNPGQPEEVVGALRRAGDRPLPAPERPGADTYVAATALRALLRDPEPPLPPPPPPAPPPPPPAPPVPAAAAASPPASPPAPPLPA